MTNWLLTTIAHPLSIGLYAAAFLASLLDLLRRDEKRKLLARLFLGGGFLCQTV